MALILPKRHPRGPDEHGRTACIARGHGSEGVQTGTLRSHSYARTWFSFDRYGRGRIQSLGSKTDSACVRAGIEVKSPINKEGSMMDERSGLSSARGFAQEQRRRVEPRID